MNGVPIQSICYATVTLLEHVVWLLLQGANGLVRVPVDWRCPPPLISGHMVLEGGGKRAEQGREGGKREVME